MKALFPLLFFFLIAPGIQAQDDVEGREAHLVSLGMGFHSPAADLADRFGGSKSVNLSWEFMRASGFLYGIEGGVFFGGDVKEPNLGANLLAANGRVIGASGFPAQIDPSFFAYKLQLNVGLVKAVKRSTTWSWVYKASLTFLEHKIDFDVAMETVPQLSGDYVKGYDRLSNGFGSELYFGMMHLDENRLKNFQFGIQVLPSFTGERRAFNFDTETLPDTSRFDLIFGFKASWILPIYTTVKDQYFYN